MTFVFNTTNTRSHILLALVLTVLLLLTLGGAVASAQSLWSDTGPAANLFGDRRAHGVGDILTVIISETSTASRTGAANNTKTTSMATSNGTGLFATIATSSGGDSNSFKAQGTITNSNSASGRVTVTVTEVKPNGDLLISGAQTIKQNNEEQTITVSGEVRQDDISPENTIASSSVANARIRFEGRGPIAAKQRQGILSQILNFLF